MQVIPVIFRATNEQKFLVCEQAFSAKSELNIIVHCSTPPHPFSETEMLSKSLLRYFMFTFGKAVTSMI